MVGARTFFFLLMLTPGCLSETFGPAIDYGSGPLVGDNNQAIVDGDVYVGSNAPATLSRSVPFEGDNNGFLAISAWVGRPKSSWNDMVWLTVPIRNTRAQPQCFLYVENLRYLDADGTILAHSDKDHYITGASGVWEQVQVNACIEPGGTGFLLAHANVPYDAVARIAFDRIDDDGYSRHEWRQPAAALIPQSFTFSRDELTRSSELRVTVTNLGLEPAVVDLVLTSFVLLSANDFPIYHGAFSSFAPQDPWVLPGSSVDFIDTQFIVPYDGPVVRVLAITAFTDQSLWLSKQAEP